MRETFSNALDRHMNGRRKKLGLRWVDVAQRGGITTQTLRELRAGIREPRELTKAAIERALEWAAGSIDAIRDGDEPTEVPQPVEGADVTPQRANLMDEIVAVRKWLGEEAAWVIVRAAFDRPVERDEYRESPPDGNSAAS
jgi:hypothetical protein